MLNRNRSHSRGLGALLGLTFLIVGLAGVAAPLPTISSAAVPGLSSLSSGAVGGRASHPLSLPVSGQQHTTHPGSFVATPGSPAAVDAYAHLVPNPVLTATVGTKFTIDLLINSGSNAIVAQQSYMTFTNSLLQVVNIGASGCVTSTTVSPDLTTFSVTLQNMVDNGAGEIAYASGTFGAPVPPATDFRVAQISFCASALGDAIVHWQFSPPAPANRNSKITDSGSNTVSNPAFYVDEAIHIIVIAPTATSTATRTQTNTPTSTNTPTKTPTRTSTTTNTPSSTPTNTPLPTQTTGGATATPVPPSNTPLPPTSTSTASRTNTPVTPSNTPLPPTATLTATRTNTATSTHTSVPPTMTSTSTRTSTPVPTQTQGGATATPVPPSNTPVPPTSTSTATQTNTPVPTQTPGGSTATPLPTNTPTSVASATATVCPIEFSDVPSDNAFYAFVRCLGCRGIISGYADGTFRPGNDITRGQIAKMVSNAAGFGEDPGPQIYEDVDSTNPFYQWINRLSNRGFMGGYPCGTVPEEPCNPPEDRPYFRPFANATRGQLAKIVSNAAGIGGSPTGVFYTDVQEDNPFYVWVMRLTDLGVMSGYDCGGPGEPCDGQNRPYFRPFANVTRGQSSKIVANTFYPDCQTPLIR